MAKRKLAVVLVHGQGEQRPMNMGADFARHVLGCSFEAEGNDLEAAHLTVRPETERGMDDVRRIEVRPSGGSADIDLFEFYWAPRMAGNSTDHFKDWFFAMLRRPNRELPKRFRWLQPAIITGVVLCLLITMAYGVLTVGAMYPVQIVQVAADGWVNLVKFKMDTRFALLLASMVMLVTAMGALARKRYGWCLSFCVSLFLVCAVGPRLINFEAEVAADAAFMQERFAGKMPPFDFAGNRLEFEKEDPSQEIDEAGDPVAAAGEASEAEEEIPSNGCAGDAPDSQWPLRWDNLAPSGGAELNDICNIRAAFANPVSFARVADSGYVMATALLALLATILWVLWQVAIRRFLVEIMGDSARYLNNHPSNAMARHDIRSAGLEMLRTLAGSKRYDRIIVFAHSLGSVVAYDILRQYWGQFCDAGSLPEPIRARLKAAAERLDADNPDPSALSEWQNAQRAAFEVLDKWPISDFITAGSPLTYGRIILEGSPEAGDSMSRFLCQRDVTGAAPACPPVLTKTADFGKKLKPSDTFVATCWTNLYFANDGVGGPLAADADGKLFGPGVDDREFQSGKLTVPPISHNSYWLSTLPPRGGETAAWISLLRDLLEQKPEHTATPEVPAPKT